MPKDKTNGAATDHQAEGSQPRDHNSRERAKLIVEVFQELKALDDEKATTNSEWRERLNGIVNEKIKGILGMKKADFLPGYRLWLLKQQAEDKDGAKREIQQYLDTLRETLEAAEIGEQLDWVDAAERTKAKAPTERAGTTDTLDDAKRKGTAAGKEGKNFDTNPYPANTKHHEYWAQNWRAAQDGLAKGIKKTPSSETVETAPAA